MPVPVMFDLTLFKCYSPADDTEDGTKQEEDFIREKAWCGFSGVEQSSIPPLRSETNCALCRSKSTVMRPTLFGVDFLPDQGPGLPRLYHGDSIVVGDSRLMFAICQGCHLAHRMTNHDHKSTTESLINSFWENFFG